MRMTFSDDPITLTEETPRRINSIVNPSLREERKTSSPSASFSQFYSTAPACAEARTKTEKERGRERGAPIICAGASLQSGPRAPRCSKITSSRARYSSARDNVKAAIPLVVYYSAWMLRPIEDDAFWTLLWNEEWKAYTEGVER